MLIVLAALILMGDWCGLHDQSRRQRNEDEGALATDMVVDKTTWDWRASARHASLRPIARGRLMGDPISTFDPFSSFARVGHINHSLVV